MTRGHVILAIAIAACADDPPTELLCAEPAGRVAPRSQCGPTLELTPIHAYAGDLAAVQQREDAVALLNGCTGTYVAALAGPIVLTAGHCAGVGDRVLVAFNHEAEPDGDPLVTEGTVLERGEAPDFALVELDALPDVTPTPLARTAEGHRLAIIQHARGGEKTVAVGELVGVCGGILSYAELDTLVGSSGAGVLDGAGRLVGVHTDGTCTAEGGVNYAWTVERIVAASAYLEDADMLPPE